MALTVYTPGLFSGSTFAMWLGNSLLVGDYWLFGVPYHPSSSVLRGVHGYATVLSRSRIS